MKDSIRGFCAQVYQYVKSDMNSDFLGVDSDDSFGLADNAEIAAARIGLDADPRMRFDAMRMMEKTAVLPVLLFKRRDVLDLDDDGDITKGELEEVLAKDDTSVLDRIAAEYALTRFDEVRSGFDPFDWFENLETGEIWDNANDARREPEMEPETVYYGAVTEAPAIGEDGSPENRCCPCNE